MSLAKSVKGSIQSGWLLGDNPDREEILEEVKRLEEKGKQPKEIGKQIGVFMASKDMKEKADILEEILTERYESYGGEN